jgi:hypothetical protein
MLSKNKNKINFLLMPAKYESDTMRKVSLDLTLSVVQFDRLNKKKSNLRLRSFKKPNNKQNNMTIEMSRSAYETEL